MKKLRAAALLLALLLPVSLGLNLQEDDLVFDDVGDEASTLEPERSKEQHTTTKPSKSQHVERLLGMPDAIASVGHVFKLHVPKQAFAGNVDYYEARGSNGKTLPHWLRWDEPASALYGVPSRKDVGRHRVSIKAYGRHGDIAQDWFIIHVVPEKREHYNRKDGKKRCSQDQDRTMLTVLIDARYESLKPSSKVRALENLAGFLGLHPSSISIQPEIKESSSSSVVLSGPGNVGRRREKHSTFVQWQVGCDGHFWPNQINIIKQIPEQARDGTLSEVMELPVYQWRVRADSTDYARNRRDAAAGSGDGLRTDEEDDDEDDDQYDDYEEEYDDNSEGVTETPQEPKRKHTLLTDNDGDNDEHPHRHRHGYGSVANIGPSINTEDEEDFIWKNAEINNSIFNTTPSTTTTTTSTPSTTTETEPPPSTPITLSTTSTTTTTTTETPTTPSLTTTDLTTTSTTVSATTEQEPEPSNSTIESTLTTSTTSTTTTQATSSIVETQTNETAITTVATNINLTHFVTGNASSQANVATDSMTIDNEEQLVTEQDLDNETESDEMTTMQPILFIGSESPMANGSSGAPVLNISIVEMSATTLEPNATSIFTVNATTEEYPEASVPVKETSSPSSSSFSTNSSDITNTDKVFEEINPFDTINVPLYSSTPTTTTRTTTTEAPTITSTSEQPTTPSTTTTTTTTEAPTSTSISSTTPSTTTTTTTSTPTTTTMQSTTRISTTSERIEYGIHNNPPRVERRLKKIPVTQGKPLSYVIPEETFRDDEDGNTRQLRLRVYENDLPLKHSNWLQFNEATQEIYGLPLDKQQYGTFSFEVIAMDSQGMTTSATLDISVQQHKQIRAVNHEFHVYLKIQKRSAFPTNVDWQLKVMRSLAELYGDEDLSYITVRSIDIEHDRAIYSWTNDSLARSSICPQDEINKLYSILVSDENTEEPSERLIQVLGHEIKPDRVVYQGLQQCERIKETQVNKYPVPRNQIDQLNATVGQLFVYKVPKDTFFDEEDGDTGSMKATLLTANRTEIPASDWLQFDSSNQEFYGVPSHQDIGRKTYQLVVKDKEGLEATDSLVAEVHSVPNTRHVVEISMMLNMGYDTFAKSAQKKREFIQKLQKLYGSRNTSAISLLNISGNRDATTVTWSNLTLPTNECPSHEVDQLRSVLGRDNNLSEELIREFNSENQPEFAVIQLTVKPMGVCREVGMIPPDQPPVDDSTSIGASHDDHFFTIILPTIIIAALILLAAIIACILYKRKRSGKMSVSEKDDERQSFRSKGIPVIFQDELDEKPDPGNKSPIILKEEKPPLPPPEYQRAEDGADIPMLSKENSEEPYQPPPPFATNRDSNRQNRPKPTPTYRKPPPYVPP